VAQRLKRNQLLAHYTATLPGVAALPERPVALARLQRFKQRQSPFLLLINSGLPARIHARHWIAWRSLQVRRWINNAWPGTTTLLLRASQCAPSAAVDRGRIALRMVADNATTRLLTRCGGVLYSSSLNRRGAASAIPSRHQRWRWRRCCCWVTMVEKQGSGTPSSLVDLHGKRAVKLR